MTRLPTPYFPSWEVWDDSRRTWGYEYGGTGAAGVERRETWHAGPGRRERTIRAAFAAGASRTTRGTQPFHESRNHA